MKYLLVLITFPAFAESWANWPDPKGVAPSEQQCIKHLGPECYPFEKGIFSVMKLEGDRLVVDPVKLAEKEATDQAEDTKNQACDAARAAAGKDDKALLDFVRACLL